MSQKPKTARKLVEFDAARYLSNDEAIVEYLTAVQEANDPNLLLLALDDAVRAKRITQAAGGQLPLVA